MKKAGLFACILVLAAFPAFGFETVKNLTLSADGLDKVDINSGAGSLSVAGREGLAAVEVEARIVVEGVSDKDMEGYIKDHVELELRKSGGTAVLVSHIRDRGFFGFSRSARIDLTVKVPKALALAVDDGSGSIEVENIAAEVRIDDGSGGLRLSRIAGDVRIDDGSGGIRVEGVEGNLEVTDGSGEIEIRDVKGDVALDDGSGGVTVRGVGGSVTVDDGSGSLEIDDVGRDVVIKHKGSGSVDITNVKGKVVR
jgi:hypothetical protein